MKKTQQSGEETQQVLLEQHPSYHANAFPDSGYLHMFWRDFKYYTVHPQKPQQE